MRGPENGKVTVVGYAKAEDLVPDGFGYTFKVMAGGEPEGEYEALMTVGEHTRLMTEALIPDYSIPTLGIIAYRYWKDKFGTNEFIEADEVEQYHRNRYDLQPLIFLQDHQSIVRELLDNQPPTPEQVERLSAIFDEPAMTARRAEVAITNQVTLDQTAQFDLVDLLGDPGPDRQAWLEKCAVWIENNGANLIGK